MFNLKYLMLIPLCIINAMNAYAQVSNDKTAYCNSMGGVVQSMAVEDMTATGTIKGLSKKFCKFHIDSGIVDIGLETYTTTTPNIAASYIKTLTAIDPKFLRGPYANPSHNVCKNLKGTMPSFVIEGSFSDAEGQSDICVFGDGSMVSAWSLIYIVENREGYDLIKNTIRSAPLPINITQPAPSIENQ